MFIGYHLLLCSLFRRQKRWFVARTFPASEGVEELPTGRTHHALAWLAAASRRALAVLRRTSSRRRLDRDRPLPRVPSPGASPPSNFRSAPPTAARPCRPRRAAPP